MKYLIIGILITIGSLNLFAQHKVTGVVAESENGSALVGVNIVEKGTTNGTVSQLDGSYTLTVRDSSAVLVASFIRYIDKEIQLLDQNTIEFSLEVHNLEIEEVVPVNCYPNSTQNISGIITELRIKDTSL